MPHASQAQLQAFVDAGFAQLAAAATQHAVRTRCCSSRAHTRLTWRPGIFWKLGLQVHRDRLMVMKLADVPVGVADRVVNRIPALPLVHKFQSCEVSLIALHPCAKTLPTVPWVLDEDCPV